LGKSAIEIVNIIKNRFKAEEQILGRQLVAVGDISGGILHGMWVSLLGM
jgi:hypothetical protein